MKETTVRSMAWGAGGALALTALVSWLSERASQSLKLEARATQGAPASVNTTATLSSAGQTVASAAPLSTPAPARVVPVPVPGFPLDEPSLMAELRRIKDTDPRRAIELCRTGNERYPDSEDAPERASILIHALVTTGQPSQARGEAEDMVNRYPDSTWVREIEQFTGAHRHRNVRLNATGQLEYY